MEEGKGVITDIGREKGEGKGVITDTDRLRRGREKGSSLIPTV